MKINELIAKRKEIINNDQWANWLKTSITVKSYIPYSIKCALAQRIIETSCYQNGEMYIDSPKKYVLFIFTLITEYTDIVIEPNQVMQAYDDLNQYNLINDIKNLISKNEYEEFSTILQMKYDDIFINNYEPHAYINKMITKFSYTFAHNCKKAIEQLSTQLDSLDKKKLSQTLTSVENKIKDFKK